jgi:hypothetical protein
MAHGVDVTKVPRGAALDEGDHLGGYQVRQAVQCHVGPTLVVKTALLRARAAAAAGAAVHSGLQYATVGTTAVTVTVAPFRATNSEGPACEPAGFQS